MHLEVLDSNQKRIFKKLKFFPILHPPSKKEIQEFFEKKVKEIKI